MNPCTVTGCSSEFVESICDYLFLPFPIALLRSYHLLISAIVIDIEPSKAKANAAIRD